MNITEEEIRLLEGVASVDEWNAACSKIKQARRGSYPPDWWPRVKLSGLMDRVLARFGSSSEIKIGPIR